MKKEMHNTRLCNFSFLQLQLLGLLQQESWFCSSETLKTQTGKAQNVYFICLLNQQSRQNNLRSIHPINVLGQHDSALSKTLNENTLARLARL